MYAIIETGGKQYRVSEGSILRVEKLSVEKGGTIQFDKVLMIEKDGDVNIGHPCIAGAVVGASVLAQDKARKILVFKYKPKKGYKKKFGHRQPFTEIRIDSITA